MTLQYGDTLRTNQVGQIQSTTGGPSALLKIWAGTIPGNCAAADVAGTNLLCTITLPNPFLQAGAAGVVNIAGGPWTGTGSANAGSGVTATHFRIYVPAGTVPCIMQGNVTSDLALNNPSIANGQSVSVTAFTITAGNP